MPLKDEIHQIYNEVFSLMDAIWTKAYKEKLEARKKRGGSFAYAKTYKNFYGELKEDLMKDPIYAKLARFECRIDNLSKRVSSYGKWQRKHKEGI